MEMISRKERNERTIGARTQWDIVVHIQGDILAGFDLIDTLQYR